MSISTSSTTSSLTSLSTKTGIGGLVSGMDTDQLVESLTLANRTKITKQEQDIQRLEWAQTSYRDVTKDLKEFQTKYFDVLSDTNIRSSSFFNTTQATSSASNISILSSENASEGMIKINAIRQLATQETLTGIQTASSPLTGVMTSAITGIMTEADVSTLLSNISGKSMVMTLDGTTKLISFDDEFIAKANENLSSAGLQVAFQEVVDEAYGVKNPEDRVVNVSITDDVLNFSATGSTITLTALNEDTQTLDYLGLTNEQSNKLTTNSSLADLSFKNPLVTTDDTLKFTINGEAFEFNTSDSLESVIEKINSSEAGVTLSYSAISDKFSMVSKTSGVGENIVISEEQGNLFSSLGLTAASGVEMNYGKNAILTVDGQEIVRSSNDIIINGAKINLNETTQAGDDPIIITLKENGESLFESIKTFIEDYNKVIDKINSLTKESKNSDYDPLTAEQKKEMTETEIEDWEKKAKSGILKSDSILRDIASKLQTAMYSSVKKGGISLASIGITSAGYAKNDILEIDDDVLKKALNTNMADIKELFTRSDTGLSNVLNDVVTGATKTSGPQGTRGSLIEKAGYELTLSDIENRITKSITQDDDYIVTLKARLENQEAMLWKKFTAMETAIQRLNTQSSMFTQFSSN